MQIRSPDPSYFIIAADATPHAINQTSQSSFALSPLRVSLLSAKDPEPGSQQEMEVISRRQSSHTSSTSLLSRHSHLFTRSKSPSRWTGSEENVDFQFWWHTVGRTLAVLLRCSGYSPAAQSEHLTYFITSVAPRLGPSTAQRKSCLSDDGCPVELGWRFGSDGLCNALQYTFEPRACLSTRESIPSLDLVNDLVASSHADRVLFDHFSAHLTSSSWQGPRFKPSRDQASQFAASHRLSEHDFGAMVSFSPRQNARRSYVSALKTLEQAMRRAPGYKAISQQCESVFQFLSEPQQAASIDIQKLSFDLHAPDHTAYTLYIRHDAASLESIRNIILLGGRLDGPALATSLSLLRKFSEELFSLPGAENTGLFSSDMRIGMSYSFTFSKGQQSPIPTLYLPTARCKGGDGHTAAVLSRFILNNADGPLEAKQKRLAAYNTALSEVSSDQDLSELRGLQSKIGCTLVDGRVEIESFINPGACYKAWFKRA